LALGTAEQARAQVRTVQWNRLRGRRCDGPGIYSTTAIAQLVNNGPGLPLDMQQVYWEHAARDDRFFRASTISWSRGRPSRQSYPGSYRRKPPDSARIYLVGFWGRYNGDLGVRAETIAGQYPSTHIILMAPTVSCTYEPPPGSCFSIHVKGSNSFFSPNDVRLEVCNPQNSALPMWAWKGATSSAGPERVFSRA